MKPFRNQLFLSLSLIAGCSIAPAAPVKFGHLTVIQNGPGNAAADITVTKGAGSSEGWSLRTPNRGDYGLSFGGTVNDTVNGDVAKGVPITSVSQHSTTNPINNGTFTTAAPYTGTSLATTAIESENTDAAPSQFRVVLHRASNGASLATTELNINSAFAYFPYSDWLAGYARNSSRTNGGTNNLLVASPGIRVGTEFVDLTGGQSSLDLRALGGHSFTGILLVNHAKDESNFALSRANDDGTFTIIVHDNGADASTYERDPLAFAFVPLSKVGTENLVAAGRITGNGTAEIGAGSFVSTKLNSTGEWLLQIPGQNHGTGVLIISPEGGEDTNVDNIIAYQWDETRQGWVIQSRDLNGGTASMAGLQNLSADVPAYSFAFFANAGAGNLPPTVSVASPASGSNHASGTPLNVSLNVADTDGSVAKLEVYEGITKVGEVAAPFTNWTLPSPSLGKHLYTFKVTDDLGSIRTSDPFEVNVTPVAGEGSLFFDGTDDYVTFGDAPELKLRMFTLETWFKREGAGIESSTGSGGISGLPLISKGRGENDNRTFNCNYFLGVRQSDGVLVADFEDYNSGLNHPVTGRTPTQMGVWNHAAVTFDGTQWKLYLNGQLEATSGTNGQVPEWVSIQHAGLGAALNSTGTPEGAFCGYMDEVRIWDYARSGEEIAASMGHEILSGGGLVARYGFDQSAGTELSGSVGPAGSLTNGPFWTPAYGGLTPSPNQLPVVALLNPAGEHTITDPLILRASATDANGTIAKVEFFSAGEKIGEATSAPYEFAWTGAKVGTYRITARAIDNEGASASSSVVEIRVMPQAGQDALYFDGVDDYATLGANSATGLRQFTLETWFRKEVGGSTAGSGSGGVTVVPLISHGRGENDNNTFNCNYLFGIRPTDGVLAADFEEGPAGASPGLNHPVTGSTPVTEGVWHHAALTYDGTTMKIYLDGNLDGELAIGQETAWNTIQHFGLGTAMDSNGLAEGFLHGMMDETRIWNRARTVDEIRASMKKEIATETGLIARWAMSEASGNTIFSTGSASTDATLMGNIFRTTGAPITGEATPAITLTTPAADGAGLPLSVDLKALVTDADSPELTVKYFTRRSGKLRAGEDFTVIALPDTQYYSAEANGANATWFSAQTDWIVGEMDARNIKFVMHLGDITDQGALDWQWTNATNAMYRLENRSTTMLTHGVPYMMAVGNHDQVPIGNPEGSTYFFNKYFGVHPETGVNHFAGKPYYGGTQVPDSADNHYTLFSAGGVDFIAISFEYDTSPDDEDMAWADALLKRYPNHRGIVVTHHMVNTGNPASFSAMGQGIYDSLKNNKNLMLLYGGHIHGEGRRSDTFEGRTIHSVLADYQSEVGGNGWLRILKFSPKNNTISTSTYSPTLNRFKTGDSSEFVLNVDLQTQWDEFHELATVTAAAGTEASTAFTGLDAGTKYEWYATVSDGNTTFRTPVRGFTTEDDNFAPQVELTRPFNGSYRNTPATVELQAAASDDHAVTKVEFLNGTEVIATVTEAPYTFNWENVPVGSYTLFAKAYDAEGLTTLSTPVAFSVESLKPTVTVAATDALGGEFGSDKTVEFTLTRSGPVDQPLTVEYSLAGTATPGADYTGGAPSVTFPVNESTARVTLTILEDGLAEGDETAVLSITASEAYDSGSPSAATAVIADKPSQAWAHENLAGNPLSGPAQDADGDGRPNLLEYFMNTAPGNKDETGIYEITDGANGALLEVNYQRAKNLSDVTGRLMWSSDLKNWHTSGQGNGTTTLTITESVTSSTVDTDFVKARVEVSAGTAPERVFIRLNVQ